MMYVIMVTAMKSAAAQSTRLIVYRYIRAEG
jgi:hypothetical protein